MRAKGYGKPIVMLTGSEQSRQEALMAGVTAFISSGSWPEIRLAVRRILEDERSPRD